MDLSKIQFLLISAHILSLYFTKFILWLGMNMTSLLNFTIPDFISSLNDFSVCGVLLECLKNVKGLYDTYSKSSAFGE